MENKKKETYIFFDKLEGLTQAVSDPKDVTKPHPELSAEIVEQIGVPLREISVWPLQQTKEARITFIFPKEANTWCQVKINLAHTDFHRLPAKDSRRLVLDKFFEIFFCRKPPKL